MIVKKVFKYATGRPIPDGAVYLNTVTQTKVIAGQDEFGGDKWVNCWLVWHYFLVDVETEQGGGGGVSGPQDAGGGGGHE